MVQILSMLGRMSTGFGKVMSIGANTAAVGTACVAIYAWFDPEPLAGYVGSIQEIMARNAATLDRMDENLRRGAESGARTADGVAQLTAALPLWPEVTGFRLSDSFGLHGYYIAELGNSTNQPVRDLTVSVFVDSTPIGRVEGLVLPPRESLTLTDFANRAGDGYLITKPASVTLCLSGVAGGQRLFERRSWRVEDALSLGPLTDQQVDTAPQGLCG